ncbi:hypothetical protein Tco_0716805 [Tanacetum coccineum]
MIAPFKSILMHLTFLIGDKDRDETYLIDLFIWGLRPGIKEKVRCYRPRSLSDACCLAKLQETTNKLLKEMEEERDKLFGNCSRGFVEMDGVDEEKFVEKGFKLNKVDETQELAELDDKNMGKMSLDSSKEADIGKSEIKIESKDWVA